METMMRAERPGFGRPSVVAMYGCYAAGLATFLAAGPGLVRAIGLALMVAAGLVAFRLYRSPYWRAGSETATGLDEREDALRARAYKRAYSVVAGFWLIGLIYVALAFDDGRVRLWLPSTYQQANALFWGVMLLVTTLPASLLAWDGERFE